MMFCPLARGWRNRAVSVAGERKAAFRNKNFTANDAGESVSLPPRFFLAPAFAGGYIPASVNLKNIPGTA